jgi:microcystin-dependent protein
MELKYLILILTIIGIIYLLFKTRKMEKFDTPDVGPQINNYFKQDFTSMRSLGSTIDSLLNNTVEFNFNYPNSPNSITAHNQLNVNTLTLSDNIDDNLLFGIDNSTGTTYTDSTGAIYVLGQIILWAGSYDTIPPGWVLCDGTNGTPNLIDRFILGADLNTSSSTFNNSTASNGLTVRKLFNVGGEQSHQITIDELPSHQHGLNAIIAVNDSAGYPGEPAGSTLKNGSASDAYITYISGTNNSIGSVNSPGDPHENMPPYIGLYYIQRFKKQ